MLKLLFWTSLQSIVFMVLLSCCCVCMSSERNKFNPHFFSSRTTKFSTLILKFLVSWTESPHLSFRGIDVSTFLRLFYDTFHRDRAVRQLLLTAFQYLRMRPASGWDRVRRGWTLLPFSLVTGNESDMVVRAMSDGMIKSWTRLTEGYAKCWLVVQRTCDWGGLNSSRKIAQKDDLD